MNLPNYHTINIKSAELEELQAVLSPELNFKRPVVFNLKNLNLDQQREVIGLTENYFSSNNISYKFPYPIYFISDHEASISKIIIIKDTNELPKFFSQKDSKMNVKESHLLGKNKLLQQELKNTDSQQAFHDIEAYAQFHKKISTLESERLFYRHVLNKLTQAKKNG